MRDGWGRAWGLGGGGGVKVIQNLVTGDDAAKMQRSFSPAPFAQCVCYLCAPLAPEERFFLLPLLLLVNPTLSYFLE